MYYKDIFTSLGLSANESIVYEFLLKNGEVTAGEIIKKTPLKRGVVYNALGDLAKKDLISEKKLVPKGRRGVKKISYFSPNHPEKLREYLIEQENKIKKAKHTLEANIPSIISDFNLVSGKPGIRFFEGVEGVKKVIEDTLINNTKKELATFSDVASYIKYLRNWNTNYYAPKRKEAKIFERVIIPDSSPAVEYMRDYIKDPKLDKLTEILFIDHKLYPFETEINIYENKVSFVTFSEKSHIGVIIENKEIHNSLLSSFNLIWNTLKK